jgi:hypothetical protein
MADISYIDMILPEGISEYFEVKELIKEEASFKIYLAEKNTPPIEFASNKLTSKGFFEEIVVQDFPIRGKAAYLHIKRRRWLNESTGNIVYRDWNIVAKGTRMTHEFAVFLKAIARYQASKR